jgi:hypothetical protein
MKRFCAVACLLALAGLTTACGVSNSSSNSGSGTSTSGGNGGGTTPQKAGVFIAGEDTPLPTVVDFNITINKVTLNNNSGSVTVLSTPTTVDFGRLIGLRSLLGFNQVTPGTYTTATFTMSSPVIEYVNLGTNPPSLGTINGTLANPTVTVAFPTAMVVNSAQLAGLHMDFNLRQSLQTNIAGQITGVVNPVIYISAVSASSQEGQITEFTGSLISTSAQNSTFLMQGPWGFQEVIDVNSVTQFNGSYSLSSIPTDSIVSVVGAVQDDGSILASQVEVITTDKAFISGRVLQVTPSTGPAQSLTMYIGEELPAMSGNYARGQVVTINISQISTYDVCFLNNPITNAVFNSSEIVAGQRIFMGGSWDNTSGVFTPQMISLRRQGVIGQLVAGSVKITSGNLGSFQLHNNGLLGWVANGPFTVNTFNRTNFMNIDGLSGLSAAGTAPIVVGGLVLNIQGEPQVFAGHIAVLP